MSWNAFGHSDDEPEPKGWVTYIDEDEKVNHVVPVDDLKQHELSKDCECKPESVDFLTYDDREPYLTVCTHQPFDGRKV